MTNLFQESGTLPVPGLIGRVVRMITGLLLLLLLGLILADYRLGQAVPAGSELWWLGVACCFYLLPAASYVPFGREPHRLIQVGTVMLALAVGVIDWGRSGHFLGANLALLLLVLMAYVTGVGGLSYVLAGLWAVPG